MITLSATGTPHLLTFTSNLSPVNANLARLLFAQASNSPAVQVIQQNTATKKLYTFAVKPGTPLDANRPAGDYTVEINEGTTTLVSSMLLHLFSQSATLLYAVGQASNNPPTLRAER